MVSRDRVMKSVVALVVLGAVGGCGANEEPTMEVHATTTGATGAAGEATGESAGSCDRNAAPAAEPTGPQPLRTLDDGSRLFGAEMAGTDSTPLATIAAAPDTYREQVVRTDGTIERVCQRMGCWMELRAENGPTVRVPMGGHAFFLPRDVQGRPASIEGRVHIQNLTDDVRRHLESEGAMATAAALSIEASSVLVH